MQKKILIPFLDKLASIHLDSHFDSIDLTTSLISKGVASRPSFHVLRRGQRDDHPRILG